MDTNPFRARANHLPLVYDCYTVADLLNFLHVMEV